MALGLAGGIWEGRESANDDPAERNDPDGEGVGAKERATGWNRVR